MSKRLQILLEESEIREIRKLARKNGLTVAEWVRQVLRTARRGQSQIDPARKIEATRRAVRHRFPTGDIDQILDEIGSG
jgi:hypothetical protein